MNRRFWAISLLAVLAAAPSGCVRPMEPYEKGLSILQESRAKLIDGDRALINTRYDRAAKLYGKAAGDLAKAVDCLGEAEGQVDTRIRVLDAESHEVGSETTPAERRTVDIGGRDVNVGRYYAETLRGYREALALAVVMRSLALARSGEAHYRGAAERVLRADQYYDARQFAAAEKAYGDAGKGFRSARTAFGEAATFIARQMIGGDRLARAAPPGTWPLVDRVRQIADLRGSQSDAYLAVAVRRTSQATQVCQAYRMRDPGNVPDVEVRPLAPLPDLLRQGVRHPTIPSASAGP